MHSKTFEGLGFTEQKLSVRSRDFSLRVIFPYGAPVFCAERFYVEKVRCIKIGSQIYNYVCYIDGFENHALTGFA